MRKRILQELKAFIQGATKTQLGVYASSGAFFLFLALFPLAALACSLLPFTPLTQETVLEYLSAILPDVMETLLREIIEQVYDNSVAALSLSALLILWSASKSFIGLMRGLNRVYGGALPGGFFRVRAISGFYTLVLLVVMVASLLLILFQRKLISLLVAAWPESRGLVSFLLNFRFLTAMLLLALFFAALYKFLPSTKLRFRSQLPGAMAASALWMLLSWIFSSYMRQFGGGIYGSLATVVFALFWIYWCMYITLLGAYFNVWLENRRLSA